MEVARTPCGGTFSPTEVLLAREQLMFTNIKRVFLQQNYTSKIIIDYTTTKNLSLDDCVVKIRHYIN